MRILTNILTFWSVISIGATSEPLSIAAEYYFQRHDYRQALTLWNETLRRRPDHLNASLRVAELRLLFEGRGAARDTLQKFMSSNASLSIEGRRAVQAKWIELQAAFITDEGQSIFLQAVPKIRRKDCSGALPLLNHALGVEKGNVRVLRERAHCEKALGQFDRYYETLKAANDADPYSVDILEALMEAHIFNSQFENSLAVAQLVRDDGIRSPRFRTALAFALLETGASESALPLLQSILAELKTTTAHPVVYLALGKILSKKFVSAAEASGYLERFTSLLKVADSTLIDGWDPYRTQDRLEEAQKLLAQLAKSH